MRPYFASYYRWLVASRQLRPDLAGQRILDVGCDDATFLRRSQAALRVGLDLAPRTRPEGTIEIVRADARRLPLESGSFASILCFDVFEHIVEDQAVLLELLRVLAPGGTLWFSTPARESRIWPGFLQPYANQAFGHVRNGYSAAQLQALLPAGWQLELLLWNEPVLRAAFVPLHLLDRLAPPFADLLTYLAYRLDTLRPQGLAGHLFGRITRTHPNQQSA